MEVSMGASTVVNTGANMVRNTGPSTVANTAVSTAGSITGSTQESIGMVQNIAGNTSHNTVLNIVPNTALNMARNMIQSTVLNTARSMAHNTIHSMVPNTTLNIVGNMVHKEPVVEVSLAKVLPAQSTVDQYMTLLDVTVVLVSQVARTGLVQRVRRSVENAGASGVVIIQNTARNMGRKLFQPTL